MPSYTTSLRLVQPATGEYSGTWGTEVNTGLTALVDASIAGTTSITMTAANYTLTNANGVADEARAMFLVLGGTPGASFAVIVPSVSKLYFVTNNTGFAQTVRTSGTGISVPNGASMTLRCDGTNVVVAQNYFASMTLGSALPTGSGGTGSTSTTYCSLTTNVTGTLPVANGGTGATTSTGTGAVVLSNSPTLVTPVLGTPTSGNFSSGSFTWPTFNQNTTGTASNVTGIVAVANGGTGQTTQQAAINSLAGATTSGQFLRGNGTNVVMSAIQVTDVPTLNQNTTGTAAGLSATLAVSSGGTGAATFTANNVLLGNGTSAFQAVAPGTNGNVLTSNGTTWQSSAPSVGVATINFGTTGLTPSTATNGAVNVAGTLATANGGTGLTSFTANGIVYASSTSALATSSGLTFDGTNFATTGTASATKLIPTGGAATGNGMYLPAANTLAWSNNGAETMRLDSSGNLGIGTSSPGAKLHINSGASDEVARFEGTGEPFISLYDNGTRDFYLFDTTEIRVWGQANKAMAFATNNTERARITPGGEVYIAGTTDQGAYNLQVNGTGVWGAGAYVNGSDKRLKDNIQTLDDGLSVVSQLRPVTFQYKPEYSKDQSVQPGFIAQELQQAMDGKDYLDGVVQSGPKYLNVAYQNLIPILTKAIQEQQALITDLRARVAALEAA